ncbi:MAG: hypothetical protein IKP58_05000 [Victivallales bacterium]|nr:hypothetical protein [Victivallales bacterium]
MVRQNILPLFALLCLPLSAQYDWTADIQNASKIKNTVQVYYQNGKRDAIAVDTPHIRAVGGLENRENNALTLLTPNGIRLADGTFDTYVIDSEGKTYWSSLSPRRGRFNAFRLGYYYYDVHILDQAMSRPLEDVPEAAVNAKIDAFKNFTDGKWVFNDLTAPEFVDGVMRVKCTNAHDPWIGQLGIEQPTEIYPAIEVTMRTEKSSMMHVYMAVGDQKGFNPQQIVPQSIKPGDFHTYKIYIDEIKGFNGNIHGIRFDLGQVDEIIEIKSIKLVAEKRQKMQVKLDRILHAYPDKMHQMLRFVTGNNDVELKEYGCQLKITKSTVAKVVVKDKNGIHDTFNGIDASSVEYVGFDNKQGGVFGLIFPTCPEAGQITFSENQTEYVLTQSNPLSGVQKPDTRFVLAHRLHHDASHDFAKLAEEAFCERNPLTAESIKVLSAEDGGKFFGYNKLEGTYDFDLAGTHFSAAYYKIPQKHYKLPVTITADDHDRRMYFCIRGKAGGLECAAMLDEQEKLLPMPIEVSKNFHGDGEEPYFYPEDSGYGETLLPLLLNANTKRTFTILNLFQNWGIAPLKQLSAIKFFVPYYHLSCGVTETNCIAPYYVGNKSGWTLPDFRAMSAKLWPTQPQHYSVGPLYFPYYYQGETKIMFEPKVQRVQSAGPVYADVDFSYESDDDAATLWARHLEFPQTDENRTYYSFVIDFKKQVSIKDFKNTFNLFSFSTSWTKFAHLGYLNEENKLTVAELPQDKPVSALIPLGSDVPYISVFTSLHNKGVCNYGIIVKNCSLFLNGKETHIQAMLKFNTAPIVDARLTLNLDDVTFQPGDRIAYDVILVPFGDYDVKTDNSVHQVRDDSVKEPYNVKVTVGKLVPDTYLPHIQAIDQQAEFTIDGGLNNAAVRVDGFKSFERPRILVKNETGLFVPLKLSYYDYDGVQSYLNADGSYGFSFIVNTTDGPSTIKVIQ